EKTLKKLADRVRDDLTAMENISQVDVAGVRPYEISIEVPEENLRRYGLNFDQIAAAVRNSSLDIPAGSVKTSGGEVLVRTEGQKYYGPEFEEIIVLTRNDGTRLRLGDIATVRDDFEDADLFARFDGQRAALVKVYRVGDQGALDVADTVTRYVEEKQNLLPDGISIATWEDSSVWLRGRMDLLKRNAYLGLVLVFVCLLLFLNVRLAFWTTVGIPISFLGAFWLLPRFDVSLNMISLFAFIMSLGLVVDDAIVVGENIFAYRRKGMDPVKAAIRGVREMAAPVTLAVLTTVFAFIPLAYITGIFGKFMRVIPIVVISVLMVSLVEALLILPAHLSGREWSGKLRVFVWTNRIHAWTRRKLGLIPKAPTEQTTPQPVKWRFVPLPARRLWTILSVLLAVLAIVLGWVLASYKAIAVYVFAVIQKVQGAIEQRLEGFVNGRFARMVTLTVRWRYATVAAALAIFATIIGWIGGGYIKIVFMDAVEADNMIATLTMPLGTPVRQTQQVARRRSMPIAPASPRS
ncbi:MAG: efflux RND transporter permease subunit, partial [Planctomycetota bacterium]